ncbi:MAG: M3 family oligoendopeptidase [Candidatus Bipolaricaulota bacterium]|nr:M3 family oligoendopeptidase [Candidatus Bipolaricaulota bacterium]
MSAAREVGRWTLVDLIPASSGPAMEKVFADLEERVRAVEAWRGRLDAAMPAAAFGALSRDVDRAAYVRAVLQGYATLWFSEQNRSADALSLRQRVDSRLADARNRTLFVELWWKSLDEENVRRLLPASADLAHYFESLRRFAPYTLAEPVEQALTIKDVNGIRGITTVYDMMANGFTYEMAIDGVTKTLTRTELLIYTRDPDPEKRSAAYESMLKVFIENKDILAQLYRYTAGDWVQENVKLRGMASPLAVRNLMNDVPDDVVDTLLDVCRENASIYQRFFRLKARWVGTKSLRRCDIYAPLRAVVRTYSYTDAVRRVREAFDSLDPSLTRLVDRVFDAGHVDSQARPGKDTGAFCYGVVPDKTPWVLVNYNDRAENVTTLAHELGHAVHALLASRHSVLTAHSSLPLAETASNFAEMLLLHVLLDSDRDPALRRYLLGTYVDGSYGSIMRQAYFVLFEREAHRLIGDGAPTADGIAAAYLENLREQFGSSVEVPDEFRWEWLSVPHIYETPFYCYAYTFGKLLVLALYQQFEREGKAFVPKYLRILEQGGSKSPLAILDEAGFDVRKKAFWQGGFAEIVRMIDELEKLEG